MTGGIIQRRYLDCGLYESTVTSRDCLFNFLLQEWLRLVLWLASSHFSSCDLIASTSYQSTCSHYSPAWLVAWSFFMRIWCLWTNIYPILDW